MQKEREKNNVSSILPRGVTNPNDPKKPKEPSRSVEKEGAKQEDVVEEELKEDDFESIIRQKVFESKIHKKY